MSANIPSSGNPRPLDRRPDPQAALTERDVGDAELLVSVINGLVRDLRQLLGLWRPRRLDFENRTVDDTGTTKYRFEHRFGGSVRYWFVGWDGAAAPNPRQDPSSDSNTLVITSTSAGTGTLRIEEAG